MNNLPTHLQEAIKAHEAKLEAFGIIPMYKIIERQKENMDKDDNHILHGVV